MKWPRVLLLFRLLLITSTTSRDPRQLELIKLPKLNVITSAVQELSINQNFENGSIQPWQDFSEEGTQWVIENISSWSNEHTKNHLGLPPMESGTHYLWLKQDLETFGIGILSSNTFLANPGDEIKFSFWIHSSYKYFNNLQASID